MKHHPLFVLDVQLAKLARHLRMLGFDSAWKSDFGDDELLRMSREEGRVLLTRDRELFERARLQGESLSHYVDATEPGAQLREVLEKFGLAESAREGKGFLTRCLECNHLILPVKGHQIHDRIPGDLLLRYSEFFFCTRCERVYCKSSHWERMRRWTSELLS